MKVLQHYGASWEFVLLLGGLLGLLAAWLSHLLVEQRTVLVFGSNFERFGALIHTVYIASNLLMSKC